VPLEPIARDDLLGGYKRRQRYHYQPLNGAPPCQIWSVCSVFFNFCGWCLVVNILLCFFVRRFVRRRRESSCRVSSCHVMSCHSFAFDANMNVRLISSDTSSTQGRIQGRSIHPCFPSLPYWCNRTRIRLDDSFCCIAVVRAMLNVEGTVDLCSRFLFAQKNLVSLRKGFTSS
jgi:hypothetical protein